VLQAARLAMGALAFDRAAQLFDEHLRLLHHDAPHQTWLDYADSLANTGRAPESAEAYLRAASTMQGESGLVARGRAAEQLLISGHVAEADAWMKSEGILRPERMADTFAPGFHGM